MTTTSDKVDWEAQYRAFLKQELAGQEPDRFSPWSRPSAEVYLPRTLLEEKVQETPEAAERGPKKHSRSNATEGDERAVPKLVKEPVREFWEKLEHERVLLLEGPAGMGKTTWSTNLVQEYLDHQRSLHPIWIPFPGLVAARASVKDYLTQCYGVSLGQWLDEQWDSRQAVLILDGLDEVVNPAERVEALKNLPSMGPHPRRPLTILTSRPLGHSLPLVTAKIELQGLSPNEQVTLIKDYGMYLERSHQQIDIDAFIQQVGLGKTKVASSNPVRALLERPGHLVRLLTVYAETGQVLETETEVLTHLLTERLRTTGRSHPLVMPDDPDNAHKKRQVLEAVAWHVLACRKGDSQTRVQLLSLIEQVLQEHAQAGTPLFPLTQATVLLNDYIRNSSLLTRVGFDPEQFQVESVVWLYYLVGSGLANRQIVQALNWTEAQVLEFLDKKAWDPEWEPVLKSWVGQADNPFPLFERLIDKTQDDLARHRLGTAGRCLFEVKLSLREHLEYQRLSVQIPTEAFEVWKAYAERNTHKLVETSLRKSWVETDFGQEKLLVLLESPNEQVRSHVIEVFAKLGPAMPEPIQEALMVRLRDGDRNQAWLVLKTLKALGPARAVPRQEPLMVQLMDGDPYVRAVSVEILGALGKNMRKSVQQALIAKLVDEDSAVRRATVRALGKLGSGMREAVREALERRLVDDDEYVQEDVVEVLKSLGSAISVPTQEALMVHLMDENSDVRRIAVRVLGTLGRAMPERVQKALIAGLVDADWYTHIGMAHVIRDTLGLAMPELMKKALIVQLMDEGSEVRRRAVRVLGTLGRAMPEAVQETLMAWLANERRGMRQVVVEALGALGSGMRESVQEALMARLVDEDWLVRQATVEALGALGSGMRESVQKALVERLTDGHQGVRYMAVKVLGTLGQAMSEPLMARLVDEDRLVQQATVEALGNLGAGMQESVQEAMMARLVDDDEGVRYMAVRGLGTLGQAMSESVQKSLVGKLADSHDFVRLASVSAFQSVGASVVEMVQTMLMGRLEHACEVEREAVARALFSVQQQGLRFFHANHALHPGRLVSTLSATPLFSDGCASHEPVRRLFALVPLEA